MFRCGLVRAYACLGMFLPPVHQATCARPACVATLPRWASRDLRGGGGGGSKEGSASLAGQRGSGGRIRRAHRDSRHQARNREPGEDGVPEHVLNDELASRSGPPIFRTEGAGMPDASWRFSGVAGEYDAVRPRPPADLLSLIRQWAGLDRPDVVDLGAGTGLSAVVWAGNARQV